MRTHLLALALSCAPFRAPAGADEGVREAQSAFFHELNAHHGRLTEEQAVPLLQRFWAIADRGDAEEETFDALQQIAALASTWEGAKADALWRDALDRLTERFVDDPRLAIVVAESGVPARLAKEFEAFLVEVRASTSDADVKAACAWHELEPQLQDVESATLSDARVAELVAALGKFAAEHGKANVPWQGCTYSELVLRTTWAVQNLRIGRKVPEIEGKDVDGVAFKLSDYRGKVVLLDFWGFW